MNSQGFYAELPVVEDLLSLTDLANYRVVPDDWYVLITDVIGSTQAIAEGRYRQVNIVGASSIIAVLNQVSPFEVPFVFGGDGAAMAVPPNQLAAARAALLAVKGLADQVFQINLRVGAVPVAIVNRQYPLKIAKSRLSHQCCQAHFLGGGLTFATELVKRDSSYQLELTATPDRPDLRGLECRWREVPSPRDHTLTLIITTQHRSQPSSQTLYREVLATIHTILGDPGDYHPISEAVLKLSFNPRKLDAEVRMRSSSPRALTRFTYLLRAVLENVLGLVFMTLKLTVGDIDWGRYRAEVRVASDYQKLDDMLRMVIAGSSGQIQQLMQYLEQQAQAGELAYGLHISDRALLTCLIMDRRNCHFHLVDGADGGYTMAAQDLKARLHSAPSPTNTNVHLRKQRRRSLPKRLRQVLNPLK